VTKEPAEANGGWLAKLLQPKIDFYEMLVRHAEKTLQGVEALSEWIRNGAVGRCQIVRDLENEADSLKFDLERKLVESFVTPIDREDIYDMCARMDEVINASKSTVREIEAMDVDPEDTQMSEMAEILQEGTRCLVLAFRALKSNPPEAASQAVLSRKSENRFTKVYRLAMQKLFTYDDFKKVLKTREVYRSMMLVAERIDAVGEKVAHVIVKST
jgi:uncharacterized protein Yka (UPF0111/DUF47 family)